jgi:hypothetical protein
MDFDFDTALKEALAGPDGVDSPRKRHEPAVFVTPTDRR